MVTAFGVARADGLILQPDGVGAGGLPFYRRPLQSGFILYAEMARPPGGFSIDTTTQNSNPGVLPAFQISSDNVLGDGSAVVCDAGPAPNFPAGGVPSIVAGDFGSNPAAVNDFSCRFDVRTATGTGPCTRAGTGTEVFVNGASEVQFCAIVGSEISFPIGNTILSVRGTDILGRPGPTRSIIVRVVP